MCKVFLVGMFFCLSQLSFAAEELAPPPPPPLLQPPGSTPTKPTQPVSPPESGSAPVSRVILKCEVDEFVINCQDNNFCSVGPELSPNPVRVFLHQKKSGQIELISSLNGDERLVYASQQAMNCNLPSYFCQSRNGQETLQIQQVQNVEYGTQDFTVVIHHPYPLTVLSVEATARIRCSAPRN